MEQLSIYRALISVSDKTGVVEFARTLQRFRVEIISTGGTLKALRDSGIKAKSVSDVTGFPEILDGRVKTLHPKIHAGLLAIPDNEEHRQQLEKLGIGAIDMVIVNLYPFEKTIENAEVVLEDAIEQIDIGGPSMLRAAAKNFEYKAVVSDPKQYERLTSEMETSNGTISRSTRFWLAQEVFRRTAAYDAAIANYLTLKSHGPVAPLLPETISFTFPKTMELRYGENAHQQAALYGNYHRYFEQLHGKELSYNNIVDIQAAAEVVEEFSEPTVAIIKHTNPCGVGCGTTLDDAYRKALATDPQSAFGGIVAVNRPLTLEAARLIDSIFTEVIVAPEYPDDVLVFLRKKKDRRLIRQRVPLSKCRGVAIKNIAGGVLVQTPDEITLDPATLRVVTKRQPSDEERAALMFGWKVAKHVKSNAIVYTQSDRTIGIGAGQMSRVDSSRIAVMKARDAGLDLKGTVVASDAFFPFADGLLAAIEAGATAVIQPGGSVRDNEVINAADQNNIAMIFTGIRHFRH